MKLSNWIKDILSFRSLIYTALTDDECIKAKGKLDASGIPHKTKIRGIYATSTRGVGWGRKQSQYDIYVRKKDTHRAHKAIIE